MKRMQSSTNTEDKAQHIAKKQKNEEDLNAPRNVIQQLDDLAGLIQPNDKNSIAIGLVNDKLLIADDTISASTAEEDDFLSMISEIMYYFSNVANDRFDPDNLRQNRLQFFHLLFEKKFVHSYSGFYKVVAEYKSDIQDALVLLLPKIFDSAINEEIGENEIFSAYWRLTHKAKNHDYAERVAGLFQLGISIIRRIKSIEKFLSQAKEGSFFRAVAGSLGKKPKIIRFSDEGDPKKDDYAWFHDLSHRGYAVLATNETNVHAESKIVDFLLAIQVITDKIIPESPVLIGISKMRCRHCQDVIDITNASIVDLTLTDKMSIEVSYLYGKKHFDDWHQKQPWFLQEDTRMDAHQHNDQVQPGSQTKKHVTFIDEHEKQHLYQRRDRTLGKIIKIKFDAKYQTLQLCVPGDKSREWPSLPKEQTKLEDMLLEYFEKNAKQDEIFLYQKQSNIIYFIGYNYASNTIEEHPLENVIIPDIYHLQKPMKDKIISQIQNKLCYKPVQIKDLKPKDAKIPTFPQSAASMTITNGMELILDANQNLKEVFIAINSGKLIMDDFMIEACEKLKKTVEEINKAILSSQPQTDSEKLTTVGMFRNTH